MTVSALSAGVYLIVRPCCAKSPLCSATKNPAESTLGTAAMLRTCDSSGPVAPAALAPEPMPSRPQPDTASVRASGSVRTGGKARRNPRLAMVAPYQQTTDEEAHGDTAVVPLVGSVAARSVSYRSFAVKRDVRFIR